MAKPKTKPKKKVVTKKRAMKKKKVGPVKKKGVAKKDPTHQTAYRMPLVLLERIDFFRDGVTADAGINITRADAVRILLKRALDREDYG